MDSEKKDAAKVAVLTVLFASTFTAVLLFLFTLPGILIVGFFTAVGCPPQNKAAPTTALSPSFVIAVLIPSLLLSFIIATKLVYKKPKTPHAPPTENKTEIPPENKK